MSLMDIFKSAGKNYMCKARCQNCSAVSELKVPKGRTIDEFISSSEALCPQCQCATLKRIIIIGRVATPPKDNFERIKQEVRRIDKALTPHVPRKRMARTLPPQDEDYSNEPEYETQYQEVRHPVRKNERVADKPEHTAQDYTPNFLPNPPSFDTPRPKKINSFWKE